MDKNTSSGAAVMDMEIDGFKRCVRFSEESIDLVLMPLLSRLAEKQRKKGSRLIVFVGGFPAVGKSVFVEYLSELSKDLPSFPSVQPLGLDGFHYHLDYIMSHTVERGGKSVPMIDVKGCPETFDRKRLYQKLLEAGEGDALFPKYDRRIHDVIEDAVEVTGDILLIEGLWMLLDENDWKDILALSDHRILLFGDAPMLKERSIRRKMMGGLTRDAASEFFDRSDNANLIRIMTRLADSDDYIKTIGDGSLVRYHKKPTMDDLTKLS